MVISNITLGLFVSLLAQTPPPAEGPKLPTASEVASQVTRRQSLADTPEHQRRLVKLYTDAIRRYEQLPQLTTDQRLELAKLLMGLDALAKRMHLLTLEFDPEPWAAAALHYQTALLQNPAMVGQEAASHYQDLVDFANLLLDIGQTVPAEKLLLLAGRSRSPQPTPEVSMGLGRIAVRAADWNRAIGHYEKALADFQHRTLNPDPKARSEAYGQLAQTLRFRGKIIDLQKAQGLLGQAIEIYPDNLDAYFNFACLYSLSGNLKKAAEKLFLLFIKADAAGKLEDYADRLVTDPDLASFRQSPHFPELQAYIASQLQLPGSPQKL